MSQVNQLQQQIANRTARAMEVMPATMANAAREQGQAHAQQGRSAEQLMHTAVLAGLQDLTEQQGAANHSLDPAHRAPAEPLALSVLGQNEEVARNYVAGRAARAGLPLPMQPQSPLSVTQAAQMADLASVRAGSAQPANG